MANSAAGGVGFGAGKLFQFWYMTKHSDLLLGAAIGGGIVRAIF